MYVRNEYKRKNQKNQISKNLHINLAKIHSFEALPLKLDSPYYLAGVDSFDMESFSLKILILLSSSDILEEFIFIVDLILFDIFQ